MIPETTELCAGPGVSLFPPERNQPPLHLGFGMLLTPNVFARRRVPSLLSSPCPCLAAVNCDRRVRRSGPVATRSSTNSRAVTARSRVRVEINGHLSKIIADTNDLTFKVFSSNDVAVIVPAPVPVALSPTPSIVRVTRDICLIPTA